MLAATVGAPQPGNEKGRPARRPLSKLHINSAVIDNPPTASAQLLTLVPRIIATHWLRPEQEAANV